MAWKKIAPDFQGLPAMLKQIVTKVFRSFHEDSSWKVGLSDTRRLVEVVTVLELNQLKTWLCVEQAFVVIRCINLLPCF
jgi:hypothetical protein